MTPLHLERNATYSGCSLLSGGADGSITLWDLETVQIPVKDRTYYPVGSVERYSTWSHGQIDRAHRHLGPN